MKKIFNCGYKCLVSACRFNKVSIHNLYKKVNYDGGVYMSNIKEILQEKFNVKAYKLDSLAFVKSNMIIHTIYKGKGHYVYIINYGKRVLLYDPRRVFSYRIVKKNKLSKYINMNEDVYCLLIDNKINFKSVFKVLVIEILVVIASFFVDMKLILLAIVVYTSIKIIKR